MKRTILLIVLVALAAADIGFAQCSTGAPRSSKEIIQLGVVYFLSLAFASVGIGCAVADGRYS